MPRKVLITGGDGQLGRALQSMLADKVSVLSTARNPSEKAISKCKILKMDITDRNTVLKVINSFNPQVIINCAAYSDVDGNEMNKNLSHQVNVEGLENLIKLSSRETQIIQISSDYVFDGNSGPYSEDDYTLPINYYGKSKLEAENLLRGSRHRWAIFRPNVLYSDDLFCKANFFAWVYKSLIKGESMSIVTDQISNPTYTYDFAKSILQCILMSYEGILHIGSDNCISRYEFANEIADIFGMDKSLISPISTDQLHENIKTYIAERPKHSGLNIDKLERELNIMTCSTSYSLKHLKHKQI